MSKLQSINKDSLHYEPVKVSWATSEFLDTSPPMAARAFLYLVVLALAIGFGYSAWSSIAISVDARGQITTRAPSVPVKTEVPMRVAKLMVKNGQKVQAGDVLVEGDGNLSDAEFELLSKQHALVTDLLAQMQSKRCASCMEELQRTAPSLFQTESSGRTSEILATARQLVLEFITQEGSFSGLGAATRAQRQQIAVAERKLADIRSRGAADMLALQVENLNSDIARASSDIAARRQSIELQIAQARNRLQIHLGGMLDIISKQREQQVIVAPASGVIAQLAVSGAGELISPGVNLLEIVRLEDGLSASIFIANKDISQIDVGMKVRLKLDAFPEREYGTVDGTVERIPENVVAGERAQGQSVYEVTVKLASSSIVKGDTEYPFRLGMTLTGVVVTKHESLLTIGLRKVFKISDSL